MPFGEPLQLVSPDDALPALDEALAREALENLAAKFPMGHAARTYVRSVAMPPAPLAPPRRVPR